MQTESKHPSAAVHGNLLRLSEHRTIAIYQRNGVAWVADFADGAVRLSPAAEWFGRNRHVYAHACRDRGEPVSPLPPAISTRIEQLHYVDAASMALPAPMRRAARLISRLWRSPPGARSRVALPSTERPMGASSLDGFR